ncbi:hypothetical protein BDW74DRAFT_112991 [Aspergillus multicolor]|uniref:molybdenum cofactor biosynthesis F family protein n=1 Tax=Aspergillus multicolor TaxID=41759 RepID=UPI003CCE1434
MDTSTETPGYVPISQWPDLEALAIGYGEHLMPPSNKLDGRRFTLNLSDSTRIVHHFHDLNVVEWNIIGTDQSSITDYKTFEVRPEIFFVNFLKIEYQEQVSLVMDLRTGQVVIGISQLYIRSSDQQKRTRSKFLDASVEGYNNVIPFLPSDDLIGKHILYRYTPRDVYEHIYLNRGTFTWHCLSGTEKSLADTEPCKILKLADKLCLLYWSEKIMPVESVVVVDLDQMRSTGRFFCWDPKPARPVRMQFGSYASILGDTDAAGVVAREQETKG